MKNNSDRKRYKNKKDTFSFVHKTVEMMNAKTKK